MSLYQDALKEPQLTFEQERSSLHAWQTDGDRSALGLLLKSHTRQVWAFARKWAKDSTDMDDLMAEGMLGLIDAASKFDLEREVRFNTYAIWFIRNRVTSARIAVSSVVDVPTRTYFDARFGRLDPVANAEALAAVEPVATLGDDDSQSTDVVCPGKTPEEMVTEQSTNDQVRRLLDDAMDRLEPMERAVIRSKLSAGNDAEDNDLTQTVTRERHRAIEKRALMRLRQILLRRGFNISMLEH